MSFKIKILDFAKGQEYPIFKINRNKNWIDYGDDNNYPDYLLKVYHNGSNKHKAIINRKVDMTTGGGINATTTELIKFIENRWGGADIEEISKKINYDYEIFGGFSLMVRWSLDGTKVAAVDYIPYHKCRLSGDEKRILISKDWSEVRKIENKPVEYPIFDPLKAMEERTQIFYYIDETTGIDYYPLPYYSSTLNWIELDWEISNFHLSSVRNGFMPGFILNFATGIPSLDEMNDAYKEFEKKIYRNEQCWKIYIDI